jgi:hypothetical protein
VQGRHGDGGPQGRDTVQEGLHRAGTGQGEQEPVFVLFDLCRHFAAGHHHGGGLGMGEPRLLAGGRAQGMVQGIRRTREQQTHGMGQAGGRPRGEHSGGHT